MSDIASNASNLARAQRTNDVLKRPKVDRTNGGGALVVRTEDLKNVLARWIKSFLADQGMPNSHHTHPVGRSEYTGYLSQQKQVTRISMQTPIPWLERESGVSARTIRAILNGGAQKRDHVSLRTADALLTAMNHVEALVNGEVPVIANPSWSYERWIAYMEERGCA